MSFVETDTVTLDDRQLESCVDTIAFRRAINSFGVASQDEKTVLRFLQNSQVACVPKSIEEACFAELAAMDINAVYRMFKYNIIDTTDPNQWLKLMQAVRSANRIAANNGKLAPKKGLPPDIAVETVAECLDIFVRLVDDRARYCALPLSDADKQRRRHLSISIDIVCGRGVCWLWFCEMMFLQACAVRFQDANNLSAKYAKESLISYQRVLASALGGSRGSHALGWGIISHANGYEDLLPRAEVDAAFDVVTLARPGKEKTMGEFREFVQREEGSDMRSINAIFGYSPVNCVMNMPTPEKDSFRKIYIKSRDLYNRGELNPAILGFTDVRI